MGRGRVPAQHRRLAREGAKLTQYYSGENVCTPSRGATLTGRHAARSGLIIDVADLAESGPIAGYENRAPGFETGVHALFPIWNDVPRSVNHGKGHRGSWKPMFLMGFDEKILTDQLMHPVLDLIVAPFLGVVFPNRKLFGC